MSNFWDSDPVAAPANGGGNFWDSDPVVAAPESVTANKVARSAATGVPIVGGALNQLEAVTNATLAPVLNPLFNEKDQLKGSWSERRAESLRQQNAMDEKFAEQHPVVDTAAKIAGGVGGTIPAMMAAPAAFGLTGTLGQMAARGAASNAALGGADALVRGEDPTAPALVGGIVGAAAPLAGRAVGKLASAVRDYRNPPPIVPQNVERVAGVDIPMHQTTDPEIEAEKELMRQGTRGSEAQRIALAADDKAKQSIAEASGNISKSMDPTGASATTAPQVAGQTVQSELAQQEAARQAAQAAQVSQVGAEGENLARGLAGGAAPVTPFDAGERTGAAVAARRDAAIQRTKDAYAARDALPGGVDASVPEGLAEDIRARLNTGDAAERLHVDRTNESTAAKALNLIDKTVGRDSGLFENAVAPKPAEARTAVGLPAKATEDETVAALRAKFGDSVADAYKRQNAPPPLSLLEFIASKGGLKPNAELDAIGLNHGHRSQIPGQSGFFGTVRKNGSEIDRMREAAQEAGYFHDSHAGTSTPTEFLDAIDAELRGQKKYPAGFEGFRGKKATTAADARASGEIDRINAGHEADLADAGHGGLGPDVKRRAVALMRDEGMHADDAVETAFRQLEQEDAAGGAAAAHPNDFPGDKPNATEQVSARGPVSLKQIDDARKQLVTMYGDAKSKAIATGEKSDLRAMSRILHEFDNSISDALAAGKFSGDAKMAKELQDAARASHAEYKNTYSAKPGDEIGRAIEKILGRYADTKATPEQIMALSYGPKANPGTGDSVKVAGRLKKILSPEEFGQWKSGLFKYVDDADLAVEKRAARIDNFLKTSLSKAVLSPEDRAAMAAYSKNLRATAPDTAPLSKLQKDIARISGADGHRPATVDEVTKMITAGTGDSQRLLVHLKANLKPESWTQVRQSIFDDLLNAPAGHNDFTALQKSKRLSDYLGSTVSDVVNAPAEKAEMAKLASIYKRMVPLPGTTNPSGSAFMGAKILKKAGSNLLTMLGFAHGGVGGAVVGHGLDSLASTVKEARAAKKAVQLFYGPQAKRAATTSRLPALLAPAAVEASQR